MSKLVLYAYNLSSCSWRVRTALAYKGIQYDVKSIKSKRTNEFLAINPAGQVPVLSVDGFIIAESLAILEYLEERYPEKPLLPKDLCHRAKVREICEFIGSGIMPLQGPRAGARYSEDPEKQLEWKQFWINRGFVALEQILSQTSADGKFCYGNTFTTADCCLAPQVYNAFERFSVDMTPYPKIHGIYNELMKLEEVKMGHPNNPL